MYLICSIGCKQNSYDFLGLNHEWTRMFPREAWPRERFRSWSAALLRHFPVTSTSTGTSKEQSCGSPDLHL
ncbi:MAG: hypothetical protein DMF11_01535 [Verrucomicrobia bacterium]|nr:MAG: hypothetical protein DMF11_01535 [Verrucomicrobiota bacterium]